MDKSPDAFRTISEVADELDVPQHVLRFWESKFHQIKPLKRGGGRRYYRPADVDLVGGIKHLLYGEGYTIKGVQKILKEQGVAHVQAVSQVGGQMADAAPRTAPAADVAVVSQPVNNSPMPAPSKPVIAPAQSPVAAPSRVAPGAVPPAPEAAQLQSNHLRMLKAALFELSELKMLFESAPDAPASLGEE